MIRKKVRSRLAATVVSVVALAGAGVVVSGCGDDDNEGPAEEAGKVIDTGAGEASEAVDTAADDVDVDVDTDDDNGGGKQGGDDKGKKGKGKGKDDKGGNRKASSSK